MDVLAFEKSKLWGCFLSTGNTCACRHVWHDMWCLLEQAKLVMAGDSESSVPMVDPNKMNLVAEVSIKEPQIYNKVTHTRA